MSYVVDEDAIALVARRLAEVAGHDSKVILFGSLARGEADPRSDVDVLVIEPELQDRHAESIRLYRALRDLLIPVDIVVASQKQMAEWGGVPGTVFHAALREGRVIHG